MNRLARPVHVLVIPSEQYVPAHEPLAGIFQKRQIDAMASEPGFRFGVVSVRLRHSVPMYLKTLAFRLPGRKIDNDLANLGVAALLGQLRRRLRHAGDSIRIENIDDVPVVRSEGLYWLPPSPKSEHRWWIKAGKAGYREYADRYGVPDIIHAHNALNAGLLAAEIHRTHGVPYMLTEHSSYFHQGLVPSSMFPPVREAIEGAAGHHVVSPALRRSLEERLGALSRPSDVLPNVLPLLCEDDLPAVAPRDETSSFTLFSVGNLLPVKNHAMLLHAFAQLASRQPDVRLRLAGHGPLRGELEQLAAELDIAERVAFLGEIAPSEVRAEMLAADCLALPSRYETFGVVLIEAMACGLPIVATQRGGPETIVTPETGILVAPDNEAALADGLAKAYTDKAHFDRGTIREHAIETYGKAAFRRRIAELYQAALHIDV